MTELAVANTPRSGAEPERGRRRWLLFALSTVVLWGVWGALAGISAQRGFPETLTYCVWAITMIPPAVFVLRRERWHLDTNPIAVFYGLAIGLLGAGGQMVLFHAVTTGPAYLIFPVISLSPLITIVMSFLLLRERTNFIGLMGVVLALIALPMFDYNPGAAVTGHGVGWFILAMIVMASWGVQAYFMKLANTIMSAESIFFYMMITGLMLIPVAVMMTDFSHSVNWGWDGPWLAAGIQMLNAVGALLLVYAFRYGKDRGPRPGANRLGSVGARPLRVEGQAGAFLRSLASN